MTRHFPVVLEHESNGTVSAYVVGLPGVFAAADSERAAATAIRQALRAHLVALYALPVAARSGSHEPARGEGPPRSRRRT